MNNYTLNLKNHKQLILLALVILLTTTAYLILKPRKPDYSLSAINGTLTLKEDRTLEGKYRIFYNFNTPQKFVDIYFPTSFKKGLKQVRGSLKINTVSDELGNILKYKSAFAFGGTKLRIYPREPAFKGNQVFNIGFSSGSIVRQRTGTDFFIWDLTGGKWHTAVDSAKLEIVSPGSKIAGTGDNYKVFSKDKLTVGDDLAVGLSFEPGSKFTKQHWLLWLLQFAGDYLNYILLLISLVFAYILYFRSGKRLKIEFKKK